MTPVLNQILFKPLPSDNISEGGIIVPDSYKPIGDKGVIVAVGNGTKKRKMELQEGMIAHRVKGWGQAVEIKGELHFLMDDIAINAIEQ